MCIRDRGRAVETKPVPRCGPDHGGVVGAHGPAGNEGRHPFLAGGVAANSLLRRRTEEACLEAGIGAFLPSRALCTDNAAMVAAAGWWRLHHGDASDLSLGADPTLGLAAAT